MHVFLFFVRSFGSSTAITMGKVPTSKKQAHTYHKDAVRGPSANMHIGKRNALIKILEKISLMRGEIRSAGKARLVQKEKGKPWGAGAEARFNWTHQELLRAKAELDVLKGDGEGLVPAGDGVPEPAVDEPAVGAGVPGPAVFDIPVPAVIAADFDSLPLEGSGREFASGGEGVSGGEFSGGVGGIASGGQGASGRQGASVGNFQCGI